MLSNIYFILVLTLSIFTIFKLKQKRSLKLKKIVFQQSSIHEAMKYFLPTNSQLRHINKKAQSKNHSQKNTTKVVKTPDNKVYWVSNNVFYCAEMINGEFDPSTAKPVDTEKLSKTQLNELLFILDNLKNGY